MSTDPVQDNITTSAACTEAIKSLRSATIGSPKDQYDLREAYARILGFAVSAREMYHLYDVWQVLRCFGYQPGGQPPDGKTHPKGWAERGFWLDLWDMYCAAIRRSPLDPPDGGQEDELLRSYVSQMHPDFPALMGAAEFVRPEVWLKRIQGLVAEVLEQGAEPPAAERRRLIYSIANLYKTLYPGPTALQGQEAIQTQLQAAAAARDSRLLPEAPLIDLRRPNHQPAFVKVLVHLYAHLDHFGQRPFEGFVKQVVGDLPGADKSSAEEDFRRLLRYWAANTPFVRALLAEKLAFEFHRFGPAVPAELPSYRGTDNYICLIGPRRVGKTFYLFASEAASAQPDTLQRLKVVGIDKTPDEVNKLRGIWRAHVKKPLSEAERDSFATETPSVRAETQVQGLCRFTFYDIPGEYLASINREGVSPWLKDHFSKCPPVALLLMFDRQPTSCDVYAPILELIRQNAEGDARYRSIPIYFVMNKSDELLQDEQRAALSPELKRFLDSAENLGTGLNFFTLRNEPGVTNSAEVIDLIKRCQPVCRSLPFLKVLTEDLKQVGPLVDRCLDYGFRNLSVVYTTSLYQGERGTYGSIRALWDDIATFVGDGTVASRKEYYKRRFEEQLDIDFSGKLYAAVRGLVRELWPQPTAVGAAKHVPALEEVDQAVKPLQGVQPAGQQEESLKAFLRAARPGVQLAADIMSRPGATDLSHYLGSLVKPYLLGKASDADVEQLIARCLDCTARLLANASGTLDQEAYGVDGFVSRATIRADLRLVSAELDVLFARNDLSLVKDFETIQHHAAKDFKGELSEILPADSGYQEVSKYAEQFKTKKAELERELNSAIPAILQELGIPANERIEQLQGYKPEDRHVRHVLKKAGPSPDEVVSLLGADLRNKLRNVLEEAVRYYNQGHEAPGNKMPTTDVDRIIDQLPFFAQAVGHSDRREVQFDNHRGALNTLCPFRDRAMTKFESALLNCQGPRGTVLDVLKAQAKPNVRLGVEQEFERDARRRPGGGAEGEPGADAPALTAWHYQKVVCQLLLDYKPRFPQVTPELYETDSFKSEVIRTLKDERVRLENLLFAALKILLDIWEEIQRPELDPERIKRHYQAKHLRRVLEAYEYNLTQLDKDAGGLLRVVENVRTEMQKPQAIAKGLFAQAKSLISTSDAVSHQSEAVKSYNDQAEKIKHHPTRLEVGQYETLGPKLAAELRAASEIIGRIRHLVKDDENIGKLDDPLMRDFHLSSRTEYEAYLQQYEVRRKDFILRERAEYLRQAEWLQVVGAANPTLVQFYHPAVDPSLYREGIDLRAATPEAIKREFQAGVERLRRTERLWHVGQQGNPPVAPAQLSVPPQAEAKPASSA